MNLRKFLLLSAAGACLSVMAQSHVEGVEYYKADQLGNARELLTRNFNQAATDKAVANYYLGLIALDEGNLQQAAKYFDAGVVVNPEYGYNYAGQGAIALSRKDLKEAERLFKLGESKTKKDAAYQITVARFYNAADPAAYAKEIAKRVEKARKTNASDPSIYLFEGDVKRAAKDFGGAAGQYEMAASYDPNATEAYVKYADLFTQVNPKFAISMLTKLLQQNPASALGQRELANAYYNNNDFAKAAQEYGKYVANPNHFKQDEDRYAFLLFYSKDYQKAYDYATALLEADPGNFNARRFQFINAAQLDNLQDRLPEMADRLLAAHRSNPDNKFAPVDYNLISDELSRAKRYDEAVEVLEEAIAQNPDAPDFCKRLAMVYVDKSDLAGAADAYQRYLEKAEKPGYNEFIQQATYALYAGAQNRDSNPEAAARYFQMTTDYAGKGAAILPDNYKPRKFMGDVAKMSAADDEGVKTAAQPYYEEAVVMLEASENPGRYYNDAKDMYNYLGNYYLDRKNTAKAKEYFNQYLKYDPQNDAYRKFVEGLK